MDHVINEVYEMPVPLFRPSFFLVTENTTSDGTGVLGKTVQSSIESWFSAASRKAGIVFPCAQSRHRSWPLSL